MLLFNTLVYETLLFFGSTSACTLTRSHCHITEDNLSISGRETVHIPMMHRHRRHSLLRGWRVHTFWRARCGRKYKVLSCWGAIETKLHNKRCEHIEVSDGEEKTYLVDEVVSEGIGELDTTFKDGDNCALLEAKLMRHYTVWKTYGDIRRGCNCSKFSFFGCGC